jgi:rubrerythrin
VDNNIIFTKEAMDKELVNVKDTVSALDFAIKRELDSILYYHEIKKLVSTAQHDALEQIIEEERKHFFLLTEMKKRFLSR